MPQPMVASPAMGGGLASRPVKLAGRIRRVAVTSGDSLAAPRWRLPDVRSRVAAHAATPLLKAASVDEHVRDAPVSAAVEHIGIET